MALRGNQNMNEIISKELCTGCNACSSICPRNAIIMREDYQGFKYPVINNSLCVNCGLCKKYCPVNCFDESTSNVSSEISTHAYRSNGDRRLDCSSGGVFFDLAYNWIEYEKGIVIGAAFNDYFMLEHRVASKLDEIEPLIGSKYLQSDLNNVFKTIKEYLDSGVKVLFFGLTCQVEGILSYTNCNKDLFCVDLICMGVPSPKVWKYYLMTFFDVENIKRINYKDKELGWHRFSFRVERKDGTVFTQPGVDNYFMQCMFKGYSLRASCFNCKYKCQNKKSDLTIADCWGSEHFANEMDDNKGLSMIISHSDKGEYLVESLKKYGLMKRFNYENVLEYNSNYAKCVSEPRFRKIFYKTVFKFPSIAFPFFGKQKASFLSRIKNKIKRCLRS